MSARSSAAATLALVLAPIVCLVLIVALGNAALHAWRAAAPQSPSDGAAAGEGRVYTLYLDPSGNDKNSGRSREAAVGRLSRAQELLAAADPHTDVEIRIAPGVYTAPPLAWKFFVPGHTITFLPVGDDGAMLDAIERPVFQGSGDSGFWFSATLPAARAGSRLHFRNLQVQGYNFGGIALSGGTTVDAQLRVPVGSGFNGNTVEGMYFTKLGSAWVSGQDGYAGVDLVNSSENVIRGNYFVSLENVASGASLIHGVYLAHHSQANVVRDNHFQMVSGDPIRVRNDSNANDVFGNVFQRTGRYAQFSDWFCDAPCAESDGRARECASHGNAFHNNNNQSGYAGGPLGNWEVFPAGLTYAGGAGCDIAGEPRVRTYGNKQS